MPLEPVTETVLSKEPLGGASPSIQVGKSHSPFINMPNLFSLSLFFFFFFKFPFSLPLFGQTSVQSTPEVASSWESEGSEGACCLTLL